MLDPKYVREHVAEIQQNCVNRHVVVDLVAWQQIDERRLALLQGVEELRAERNRIADRMATVTPDERGALVAAGKATKDRITVMESELQQIEADWKRALLTLPNLTHPAVPMGETDEENVEVRVVGTVGKLVAPKDHVELGKIHDLIDFDRGAKVAGAKFYFLKGKLAILEQALIHFVLDYLVKEGFVPMTTPDLAKDDVLIGTGFNPRGNETQIYSIENTDLSLIGTAEITLGGYHKDEVLDAAQLPIKYAGLSHCYRTEAGAYGRESYGLYRVHQFSKVEMFVFCTPEQSEAMHLELLRHEEHIFAALEIPYRVVDICSGDLGGPAYRKYDLEAWIWGLRIGPGGP
jgi:seryl-tRNA synthetase